MAIGISSSFNEPVEERDYDPASLKPLRKGAREIIVHGVPFSWMAGKSTVEVRNRLTNKAYHVPKHRLEELIEGCECCGEGRGYVVRPHAVSSFLAGCKEEHGLL